MECYVEPVVERRDLFCRLDAVCVLLLSLLRPAKVPCSNLLNSSSKILLKDEEVNREYLLRTCIQADFNLEIA